MSQTTGLVITNQKRRYKPVEWMVKDKTCNIVVPRIVR